MFRNIFFLLFCSILLFSNFEASAQKIKKDTWKEFVSEEGGFKVKLPILPTRTVSKVEMAFGKADVTQFRVITRTTGFIVGFVEFPSGISDVEEIEMRYDLARDSLLETGKDRLISEKNISLNNFAGREFVIQSAQLVQTVRIFIINQRMFTLIGVTPPNLKAANQASINKFLNSFELTKLPEAKFEAVKLPDDFGSKFTGRVYRSSFFDFSVELPEDWKILSNEEIDILREIVNNEAGISGSTEGKMTTISLNRTAILAGAINMDGASIMIGAERPDFANMPLEQTMKTIRENNLSSKKEKITKDVYPLMLGGVLFYALDTQNIEDKTRQRIIVTKRKELIFQIIFTYKIESHLRILEESIKTVQFNSK